MKHAIKGGNDRSSGTKLALLGDPEQRSGNKSSKTSTTKKMSYRLRKKHELVGEYARWTASEQSENDNKFAGTSL